MQMDKCSSCDSGVSGDGDEGLARHTRDDLLDRVLAFFLNGADVETKRRRSSGCDSGDPGDGDEGLARHISDDLLKRVVALFPNVADVARFGFLSKTWYSIVHSPSFWQLRDINSPPASCLFLQPSNVKLDEGRPWFAYAPDAQRWMTVVCRCLKPCYFGRVTSSRGLICAQKRDKNVVVFNPLTNSCSTLPYDPLLDRSGPLLDCNMRNPQLSFAVDPVTLSYVVVIFHFNNSFKDSGSCFPVVYDSKTKSWTRGKTVPFPHAYMSSAAPVPALTDSFYFLVEDGNIIARYHARTDCWSRITLRSPASLVVPRNRGTTAFLKTPCGKTLVVFPSLVESMGRLVLAGGYDAANGMQQTLCIWELKEQQEEAASSTQELPWKAVELTRMPLELWFDFLSMHERPALYVSTAGAGDLICFYNRTDHRILPYLYNLSTNSWHKAPAYPGFSSSDRRSQHVGVFQPRLDSLA